MANKEGYSPEFCPFDPDQPFVPSNTYSGSEKNKRSSGRITYRSLLDIQPKPISWLWPGQIARGKVTIIAGDPGLGKSQITAFMAATVSVGGTWPVDHQKCEPGQVLILSAEDDPADTIRPRLDAVSADLIKIKIIEAVEDTSQTSESTKRSFSLKTDMNRLEDVLVEIGGASLIIIDPITAYLGSTDSHKNADVRALLAPLAELASKYEAAVIGVSHLSKSASTQALMRVNGSLAFVAAARAAFLVEKDLDNKNRRFFLPMKNNIGKDQKGFAFEILSKVLETSVGPIETSYTVWEHAYVEMTANEALAAYSQTTTRGSEALTEAKDWLRKLLLEKPLPATEVKVQAKEAGISGITLQRAKRALNILCVKEGMKGGWVWKLNENDLELSNTKMLMNLEDTQV